MSAEERSATALALSATLWLTMLKGTLFRKNEPWRTGSYLIYAVVMIMLLIIKAVVKLKLKLKLLSVQSTDHAGGSWSTFSRKELPSVRSLAREARVPLLLSLRTSSLTVQDEFNYFLSSLKQYQSLYAKLASRTLSRMWIIVLLVLRERIRLKCKNVI